MIRFALAALLMAFMGMAHAQPRRALVVGISRYDQLPMLPNAVADAVAVADVLEDAGFQVTRLTNPTTVALRNAVAQMARVSADAQVAVFYYAGHAVQYRQDNYLLAADFRFTGIPSLLDQGLELSDVNRSLVAAPARLIFVDACRDPPLATGSAVADLSARGLAAMSLGVGGAVVFSAAPGHAALDSVGGSAHSPFATAFLRYALEPKLEFNSLLQAMQNDIIAITHGSQEIEPRNNLRQPFFFVLDRTQLANLGSRPPASPTVPARDAGPGRPDLLLAQLAGTSGTKRWYRLDDALNARPLQAGLDSEQALAILGDIPAAALRRQAMTRLLPFIRRPISEREALRLLDGFNDTGRGTTLLALLPCMALPLREPAPDDILADIPPPMRGQLDRALHSPARPGACPMAPA